jgi:aminoglycoside phosphotransferase (APT) family kinase protein
MDFIEGTVIHELVDARRLTAAQAAGCCDALVDTLARLHAIDPAELDIPSAGRPGNFVERRIRSWLRQWEAVEHRDFPDLERIGAALLRDVPPQPGTTLVHGDYRLGNLMFRVVPDVAMTAILDWELSTIGDPLTDLAHLLVYWEPTCGRVTHPAQLIPQAPGFASGPALAARYAEATGSGLPHLRFYLAFEHWRAAIIKDAIYLRRRRGLPPGAEPDADLAEFGRYVQLHLDEAAELLESSAPTSYPSEE